MQHPNAVLSKEQILDALWDCDGDYIDSSALTVYTRRLRMKIEDDPGKPQMLLTVRGMAMSLYRYGYRINNVIADSIALYTLAAVSGDPLMSYFLSLIHI